MAQESSGLGEQVLNRIAEAAISSQLKQPADVSVQIKTDLNKLAQGQLDSIAIVIHPLLMPSGIEAEEFHLQIGQVTVKPLQALLGKIKLVHPSEAVLRFVINEASLTAALNTSFGRQAPRLQQPINCLLSDNAITLKIESVQTATAASQPVVLVTLPEIASGEREVVFQQVRCVEGHEPAPEFTAVLLTQMRELLSLRDFEQKGMVLKIQRLSVTAGKLTLLAAARIERFPSS